MLHPPATQIPPVPQEHCCAPRQATAPSADETNTRLTHLPTPEQIAATVRRQPIGAVFADICRDLGIPPSHPLWRELRSKSSDTAAPSPTWSRTSSTRRF